MKTRSSSKQNSDNALGALKRKVTGKVKVTGKMVKMTTREFQRVAKKFHWKMENDFAMIRRLFRVDNEELLQIYKQKRLEMEKERGRRVKEEKLFHGTKRLHIDSICTTGFLLPEKSNCLGYAICFARRSRISDRYTDCSTNDYYPKLMGSCQNPTAAENLLQVPDALRSISKLYNWPPKKSACRHYMLLCKVLLGDSAPAQRTYRSPPRIRNSKRRYDSCFGVDQNHAEDLAVYDGSQVFPEYIIEYECPAHYPLVSPREPVTLTSPNEVFGE